MSKLLLAGCMAAALSAAAQAQVVSEWVLLGEPGNQPFTPASNPAPNVIGLDMLRGSSINPASATSSFSGTGWHSLDADDYFSFGFSVAAGWAVQLDELWIGTRSSNTGPGFLGLFHSGDGFNTNLHTFVQTGTAFTYSIVDLSALGNLHGTVEFRVMALNDTAANGGTVGSTGAFRFAEHSDGTDFTPVRLSGDVVPSTGLGTPFCTGETGACPCGNAGGAGQGCAHGGGIGATLLAGGSASASAADLVLSGTDLVPGGLCIFFQGDTQANGGAGLPFGDGLRCAAGNVVRLEISLADGAGAASTTTDIVGPGGVSPGDTCYYQLWYEDFGTSPCGSGFNLSNGLALTFGL